MADGQRTDLHRPAEFHPEDYEERECFDVSPPEPGPWLTAEEMEHARRWRESNRKRIEDTFGYIPRRCDHCGHHPLRWVWAVDYKPTGEVIAMGEDCVTNRLPMPNHDAFRLKYIQDHHSKMVAHEKAVSELNQWRTENADVWEWLQGREDDGFEFVRNMSTRAAGQPLSENQTAAVRKCMERQKERDAQRAAERAAEAQAGPAPEGASTVTGTVLRIKEKDGYMGGVDYKMTVKLDDGNRVWLSVPRGLLEAVNYEAYDLEGRRVTVTATFSPSDNDPHFAFGKKPRNAQLLPQEAA